MYFFHFINNYLFIIKKREFLMSTLSREEYAKKMRLTLSDHQICKSDGTVNH